ncbi:MAG: hypothetical protein QOJ32_2934 [Frankiaceae bacterium]|nr:hypothetical protein [Frankiaceae bacterium]
MTAQPAEPAGYPRSTGSPRGEARRRELLDLVADDVAAHGLVDFSLRRAARAAGTTHKVLLYHFVGAEDLLRQAVDRLRDRRTASGLLAAGAAEGQEDGRSLSARVRAIWPVLMADDIGQLALDQAIGLAMYDPERHRGLAQHATEQYLPSLMSLCPPAWSEARKHEVAEMILATLRGFLVDWRTRGDRDGVDAGFEALARALDREEAADA